MTCRRQVAQVSFGCWLTAQIGRKQVDFRAVSDAVLAELLAGPEVAWPRGFGEKHFLPKSASRRAGRRDEWGMVAFMPQEHNRESRIPKRPIRNAKCRAPNPRTPNPE